MNERPSLSFIAAHPPKPFFHRTRWDDFGSIVTDCLEIVRGRDFGHQDESLESQFSRSISDRLTMVPTAHGYNSAQTLFFEKTQNPVESASNLEATRPLKHFEL